AGCGCVGDPNGSWSSGPPARTSLGISLVVVEWQGSLALAAATLFGRSRPAGAGAGAVLLGGHHAAPVGAEVEVSMGGRVRLAPAPLVSLVLGSGGTRPSVWPMWASRRGSTKHSRSPSWGEAPRIEAPVSMRMKGIRSPASLMASKTPAST